MEKCRVFARRVTSSLLMVGGVSLASVATRANASSADPAELAGAATSASGVVVATEEATPEIVPPVCIDDAKELQKIDDYFVTYKKSSTQDSSKDKYQALKAALKNHKADDQLSVFARLVYAETLAAECPEHNHRVAPLIAQVIGHRIERRKGDYESVIFQKDQFASSLNRYHLNGTQSRYHDFLCPKDKKLWALALRSARATLNKNSLKNSANLSKDAVHYYLFQHFPENDQPPWKLSEHPIDESLRGCLRVYRNPSWK